LASKINSKRELQNTTFICENCGAEVVPLTNGSFRNHCPFCLHSKHVDIEPGDRKDICLGLLVPIGLIKVKKGLQLIHRCAKCNKVSLNLVAQDTVQEDNIDQLAKLPIRLKGSIPH
jgi:uncharacterized protein with PIN domain